MDKDKNVDESWKESAAQEKEKLKKIAEQKHQPEKAESQTIAETGPVSESEPEIVAQEASPEAPRAPQESGEADASMTLNFLNYITSLCFQTMIFLGEIPHPVSNEIEKNTEQAKLLIDTLSLLKEKTQGNLTDQESQMLENSIYELQLKYVEAAKKEASGASDTALGPS